MDTRTATLLIRYKATGGTWKRALAARAGNGRIRSGFALVGGVPLKVELYQYQVRFYEGRQPKYESVGRNASDAETKCRVIQTRTTIKAHAPKANMTVVEGPVRKTLSATAAAYIKLKADSNATEAEQQARNVTAEFLQNTRKRFVDELTTADITRFHESLRRRGCGDRTVANKHQRLISWLRHAGIDPSILPPKPKFEQTLPTIYSSDQISTLLADDDPYMQIAMLLALKCGLRDKELMHIEFSDIDTSEKTLRVRGKPKWKFKVKDYEQRDIPVPDDLLDELAAWKKHRNGESLILANKNHRPNSKLLLALKSVARRSKLNCGRCEGCKSKRRECEEYTLHKFRRTYITTLLRNGIDLRTVQAYAGHKDLASTMRYLRPASGEEARSKVNAVRWC